MKILEGAVDDPRLGNPLERMHRLGTGWFGVIFEFEGVLVESAHEDHIKAWKEVCSREGKPNPPHWQLQRVEGMKNEQVVSEVLCLARNPEVVKRLADEKEAIFEELQRGRKTVPLPGAVKLLQTLRTHDIPVAVASTARRDRVTEGLMRAGLSPYVDAIISGDDVSRGRPDPEPYLYAALAIERPTLRCVVIGSANTSVEAAHDVSMQCVAIATQRPIYELSAADLVARQLEEISVQNLKQLFRMEEGVESAQPELQPEQPASVGRPVMLAYDDEDDFL